MRRKTISPASISTGRRGTLSVSIFDRDGEQVAVDDRNGGKTPKNVPRLVPW
jgi:hypothetical protein